VAASGPDRRSPFRGGDILILVTTGGQSPFDRLVRAVDGWAEANARSDFFAQIGAGEYEPHAMPWTRFLPADEFRRRAAESELVVSHAGMGTILTCLELGVRLLVMPRRASLRETRNEHQLATVRHLKQKNLVAVADDEESLWRLLDHMDELACAARIARSAEGPLVDLLRGFIEDR